MGTDILLSGAVLSSLLFENINHNGVGEGFLIGDIDKITTQNITDTQICLENTHLMASISGYLPCSSLQSFYTGSGELKPSNLNEIIGDNLSKIIGWYRCRGSCLNTFLREVLIHEQLAEWAVHPQFILALFSAPSDPNIGTMGTIYKFYSMTNRVLTTATYKIVNMSETSSATYYKDSPNTHLYESSALKKSLNCIDNLEPGVKSIQELYKKLLSHLKELLPEYSKVCEEQYKVMDELMKLKSLCYASDVIPNYMPEGSISDYEDTRGINNDEETIGKIDDETKANTDDEETIANTNDEETIANTDDEETIANTDDEETIANTDDEKTIANTDVEETIGNADGEETKANIDYEETTKNMEYEETMENIDDEIIIENSDENEDTSESIKEKPNNGIKSPPTENKWGKKNKGVKRALKVLTNGQVINSSIKAKPNKFKFTIKTKSPSASPRLAKPSVRKSLRVDRNANKNKSPHSMAFIRRTSRLKKRPQSNSPSKLKLQPSASPEF